MPSTPDATSRNGVGSGVGAVLVNAYRSTVDSGSTLKASAPFHISRVWTSPEPANAAENNGNPPSTPINVPWKVNGAARIGLFCAKLPESVGAGGMMAHGEAKSSDPLNVKSE